MNHHESQHDGADPKTQSQNLEDYLSEHHLDADPESNASNPAAGQVEVYRPSSALDRTDFPLDTISAKDGWWARRVYAGVQEKARAEAAQIYFETKLTQLKQKAAASVRENEAIWHARQAEVTETIRTYVLKRCAEQEAERFIGQQEAIDRVIAAGVERMNAALYSDTPGSIKDRQIELIKRQMDLTLDRIEKNTLATRNGMTQ